jgi:hypothetical protein
MKVEPLGSCLLPPSALSKSINCFSASLQSSTSFRNKLHNVLNRSGIELNMICIILLFSTIPGGIT